MQHTTIAVDLAKSVFKWRSRITRGVWMKSIG